MGGDHDPGVQDVDQPAARHGLDRLPGVAGTDRVAESAEGDLPFAVTHRDTPAGRFAAAPGAAVGAGAGAAAESSGIRDRPASRNRSAGGRPPQDWCGRAVLYSLTHPSSAACSSSTVAYTRSRG